MTDGRMDLEAPIGQSVAETVAQIISFLLDLRAFLGVLRTLRFLIGFVSLKRYENSASMV